MDCIFFKSIEDHPPIFACIEHRIRLLNNHMFDRSQLLHETRQLEKPRVK